MSDNFKSNYIFGHPDEEYNKERNTDNARLYGLIINFAGKYLLPEKNISALAAWLLDFPFSLDVYIGELNSAIHLFNFYKKDKQKFNKSGRLFINANYLSEILKYSSLPDIDLLLNDLKNGPFLATFESLINLFSELNEFQFVKEKQDMESLAGRIIIASYRTFALQNMGGLRKKGVQVASTIEEMLVLMAIRGFDTHLFHSTKHWIADWKAEGFSKELALKIQNLK